MIKIFSKEFKDAIVKAVDNLREKVTVGTETVKNIVEEAKDSAPVAKVVDMYNGGKEAALEEINKIKKSRATQEEMIARTAAKKELRDKARAEAKLRHESIKAQINEIQENPDIEEVYCQRSEIRPTEKPEDLENLPKVIETAKVTVIGVVRRLAGGRYRLQISLSRRNPEDQFIKNQGYLIALQRAIDPRCKFEIDGKEFETIKVGDFDTPLLKDLFLAIADELIYEHEYSIESYTKAMKNSLDKTAQKLVDDLKEVITSDNARPTK